MKKGDEALTLFFKRLMKLFGIFFLLGYLICFFYEANPDFSTWAINTRFTMSVTITALTILGIIGVIIASDSNERRY